MPKFAEGLYEQIETTEEEAAAIVSHFTNQVRRGIADRSRLEKRWKRAHALYEGTRTDKNFPWKGASNTSIPLVAIHASAIHARFVTTLFNPPGPFWLVKARNPDFQDFSKSATDLLDWSRTNQFDLYDATRDFAWDSIKLGMGVLKATWLKREGTIYKHKKQKDGTFKVVKDTKVLEDRPNVEAVKPEKFVWSSGYDDIQTCPWLCHILNFTQGQIKGLKSSKFLFGDTDSLVEKFDSSDVTDRRHEVAGIIPSNKLSIELYEIWGRWEVKGGDEVEVQIIIDPVRGKLLRYNLNPFFHRMRPFVVGRLEAREHMISGSGISDQIGDLNDEINTVHNQTVDATTVSIVQMFGVRAGSPADDGMTKIWPGKKVRFANPDDIQEIGLGPLKANSIPLEALARDYSERRTGISDFGLGRKPSASGRDTATGTLAIIQEGNKKFDYQVRDMRHPLGKLGLMILSMLQQNNAEGLAIRILGKKGQPFGEIRVAFDEELDIPTDIDVEVMASSATMNASVARQDAMTLFQLMMSVYQQVFQFGQVLATPGIPPALSKLGIQLARGAEVLVKDVLTAFENRRQDEILPTLEDIYAELARGGAAAGAAQAAGVPGADGGVQGAEGNQSRPGANGPAGSRSLNISVKDGNSQGQ